MATIAEPGRHADGGNLYLFVSKTGAKSWTFFYRFGGRMREKGLGSAADVTLAEARVKAAALRRDVIEGRDPLGHKRAPKLTFDQFAAEHIEAMRPSWSNPKHAAQWSSTLDQYGGPLRDVFIDRVDTEHLLAVLKPIWTKKSETASRVRGRIESVLDAAKARGLRTGDNPARWRGHLDQILPRRQRLSRGHHAALPIDDMSEFMRSLRGRPSVSARALEFTILCAARTGETIGATWSEIDSDQAIWTIPANRMKGGRVHRVPLSPAALALLRDLPRGESPYVFPAPRGDKPLSNMALAKVVDLEEAPCTVHGFRSTFRDWSAERTAFPHEVAEMALAHAVRDATEAAYRRGDLFDKRRELMNAWADFCGS